MAEQSSDNVCVVIEDGDLTDDEPGPCRILYRPSACNYEASWFQESFLRPSEQVIDCEIPHQCIKDFQDLIWNQPHDRMVPGYGMTPKELASVSSDGRKGWLVSSHFYWLSRCINQQQQHTRFFVLDPAIRKAALEKLFSGRSTQDVKRLIFVMCVGRQDDGHVFFGTDKIQGDHWSVAVVDVLSGILCYCDTLGWPAPDKLLSTIVRYTNYFGLSQASHLSVKMAHEPNNEQHLCTAKCTNYPLQTCSDVCGVIAMVCIAIAAFDKELFDVLMKPIDRDLNLYLTDPTQYSSYLRHVLIYWLIKGQIDISKISLQWNSNAIILNNKSLCNLKRKLSITCNGKEKDCPKRQIRDISQSRNGVTLNEYILEAKAAGIASEDLLSEIIDLFATKNGLEANRERIKKYYGSLNFNNTIERAKDDADSIKTYVKDYVEMPNLNPIIFFKGEGKELKFLGVEDTVLAIQTSHQKEMMKIYGKKCICMDLVRKGERKFFLVTLLVFYEGTDELPVAWLISNRYDNNVLNFFIRALKINIGELQTETLIGDMNGEFYKIWIQHFSKPAKKMFCMWDVLQVWHNRLDTFVPGIEDRQKVKNYLSILPKITDVKAFKVYIEILLEALKAHKPFLDYFHSKFVDERKDESWASCYRYIPQSKFVPFLQPFSGILKYPGFFGKQSMNRMDVFHHKLLQLSRYLENKLYIQSNSTHLLNACRDIEVRHQQPVEDLDIYQSASGEEWYIRATAQINSISIIDTGETLCNCQLKCKACQICLHRYICTCPAYLLNSGSCKHIHLVHSYRKMNSVINDSSMNTSKETGGELGKGD